MIGLAFGPGFFRRGRLIEQAAAMRAGSERLAQADRGIQLRRETQVAAPAVRAPDLDQGRMAADPPESVVGGQEGVWNGIAQGSPALLEGADEGLRPGVVA